MFLSLIDRELASMGIRILDENGKRRPGNDIADDFDALLDASTEEYAAELQFRFWIAVQIDKAAKQIEVEDRRKRQAIPIEPYDIGDLHMLGPGTPVFTRTTDNEYGWALLDYKGGKLVAIRHLEEESDKAHYLKEDDYGITWRAYSKDISPEKWR